MAKILFNFSTGKFDWVITNGDEVTVLDTEETLNEILEDVINRGVLDVITVTADNGIGSAGLNISWTAGEVYDHQNSDIVETDLANALAVTDDAINYLIWSLTGDAPNLVTNGDFATAVDKAAAKVVTGITSADPGVVTFAGGHGYVNGTVIYFDALAEMTELNGAYWKLRSNAGDTFELTTIWDTTSLDTTGYGAEVTGGEGQKCTNPNWNENAGWNPACDGAGALTGKISCDGEQGETSTFTQGSVGSISTEYQIKYTLSNYSVGSFTPRLGTGDGTGTTRTTNGTYLDYVTATHSTLTMSANVAFLGRIDNIEVSAVGAAVYLSTTPPTGQEVLVAEIYAQDGVIWGIEQFNIISTREAEMSDAMSNILVAVITEGLVISPADDKAFDIDVTAGTWWHHGYEKHEPTALNSPTMTRWFHAGSGNWDFDTGDEIDEDNYDTGTGIGGNTANLYYRSLFIMVGEALHWIYPTAGYNTVAQAKAASDTPKPTALEEFPTLAALVLRGDATDLPAAGDDQWVTDTRPVIGGSVGATISSHPNLASLAWSVAGHTIDTDIDMGGLYQLGDLAAPAASGEAIRQTATVTEANLNELTDTSDTTLHDHDGIDENTTDRHRLSNWYDEWSWIGHLATPKCGETSDAQTNITRIDGTGTGDCMIDLGGGGAYDEAQITVPSPLWINPQDPDSDDNREVVVFYQGVNSSTELCEHYATAPSIGGPYTKGAGAGDQDAPLFPYGWIAANKHSGPASIRYNRMDQRWEGVIVYEQGQSGSQSLYFIYCTGGDDPFDNANWTAVEMYNTRTANAAGLHAGPAPGFIIDGDIRYCLFKNGSNSLSLTWSTYPEGGTAKWSTAYEVFPLGAGGTWNSLRMGFPTFFYIFGTYMIIAMGQSGVTATRRVGIGIQSNIESTFTELRSNPAFQISPTGGDYDDSFIQCGALLAYGENTVYVFIQGNKATDSAARIGIRRIVG